MNLFTHVTLPPASLTLKPESRIIFIGSCFAEHVGAQMQKRMPETNCLVNPFGVLYNPVSIAQAVDLLVSNSDSRNKTAYTTAGCIPHISHLPTETSVLTKSPSS